MIGAAGFDVEAAFSSAPVAVLATASAAGVPHTVPVVFAVRIRDGGATIYTAVDAKRKTTRKLKRLANITANPRVSLLVDSYDADWAELWWVRADGVATVHDHGDAMATGYTLLRRKYPQYERIALDGPVVSVEVGRWASWHA